MSRAKKRGGGGGVERGQKSESGKGDRIGWRSILIWSQRRGRGTDRYSCNHECVCVCESRLNLTAMPSIQTSECDPHKRVGLTLHTQVSLPASTDSRNTFLTKTTLQHGGQGEVQCLMMGTKTNV